MPRKKETIPATLVEQYDKTGMLELTRNEEQQLFVFLRSLDIFRERTAKRGDHWKQFDSRDAVHHIRSKATRIDLLLEDPFREETAGMSKPEPADLIDDALDLINYCAFFVRHVTGSK